MAIERQNQRLVNVLKGVAEEFLAQSATPQIGGVIFPTKIWRSRIIE